MRSTMGMPRSRLTGLLLVAAALALFTGQLQAQDQGRLTGTVADNTGAVIPAAMVSARNTATGVEQSTQSSENGVYSFSYMAPWRVRGHGRVQRLQDQPDDGDHRDWVHADGGLRIGDRRADGGGDGRGQHAAAGVRHVVGRPVHRARDRVQHAAAESPQRLAGAADGQHLVPFRRRRRAGPEVLDGRRPLAEPDVDAGRLSRAGTWRSARSSWR